MILEPLMFILCALAGFFMILAGFIPDLQNPSGGLRLGVIAMGLLFWAGAAYYWHNSFGSNVKND
jgi:hypothetical protein